MSIPKISWEAEIRRAIITTPSMLAAAQSLGMSFGTFKYRAKKFNLYVPNQGRAGTPSNRIPTTKIPLGVIISGGHPSYNTNQLKNG